MDCKHGSGISFADLTAGGDVEHLCHVACTENDGENCPKKEATK